MARQLQHERGSRKSETGKAIGYALNRWAALTRYLGDRRVCMNNNATERALRGIAVGRRNWTFAGSDRGGERAAAVYTLIETACVDGLRGACVDGLRGARGLAKLLTRDRRRACVRPLRGGRMAAGPDEIRGIGS
jgi:hypothetical protein